MPPIINTPLPILISLTAVFSVFMHDARFNNILMTAVSESTIVADNSGFHNTLGNTHHIHVEASSSLGNSSNLRTQQPAAQPRKDNDKKYIAQRRIMGNTFGNDYQWPSI